MRELYRALRKQIAPEPEGVRRERHDLVVSMLTALGVPLAVAESDAEGIEHHVSRETLRAFQRFLDGLRAPGV